MSSDDLRDLAVQAMLARGLLPEFGTDVLHEAGAAHGTSPDQRGEIRDLRKLDWFSIDNDDTRDLDQLSVAEPLAGDAARLRVAVADVACLVPRDSAIDRHAAVNTTSVYTAAGVFPMLPEVLSTGLTSLNEGQERLAMVVDMVVAADGTVTSTQLYRAAVLNRAKLAYDAVTAWLEGAGTAPSNDAIALQVKLHDTVAARLRSARSGRGALNVKTVSARPVFEEGELVDLRADEKNRAKDLIAELMIAANAATARFLRDMQFPSLRRMLEAPRRWDRIVQLAAAHGAALPPAPDAKALDRFLSARSIVDADDFADLSLAVVKLLGPGKYEAAPAGAPAQGHFGLAVEDYVHSTAPNRRYTDLVTQRLATSALLREQPPYGFEALAALARHCTLQEDDAAKVERQVLKAAATMLLSGRVGDEFDAVVTGVKGDATYVRIAAPLVEGRLVRGFQGADVGDRLRVQLVALDRQLGHIDFVRAAR